MGENWGKAFRRELAKVNLADFARYSGRPYPTVRAWHYGKRRAPPGALHELVAYLRQVSHAHAAAADKLEAVAPPQEEEKKP